MAGNRKPKPAAATKLGIEKKRASALLVEDWPLNRIKPYAGNPRKRSKHAVEKVAASIREFGFRQPIVVDEAGEIIVGHTRLDAAVSLAMATAPVHQALGLSEQQKRAYRIADNRTNEEAEWDEALLALELKGLDGFDLSLTGLDVGELNGLLRGGPQEGEDDVPEPGPAVTERGDVWELGTHRLVCGDATSAEDVALVMCGEKPLLMVTDPPYGIGIVNVHDSVAGSVGVGGVPGAMYPFGGKRGKVGTPGVLKFTGELIKPRLYQPIAGDDQPFDPRHLLDLGNRQVIFGANFFASRLPDGKAWIAWDKGVGNDNFSGVELAWTSSRGHLRLYRHTWSGLLREGPRNEELTERVHPTQKPVGLFRSILNDFSEPDANILDPYLGSGTTLIAAETEARRCFGLEIEPGYCDVIVKRWENFTGKTAVRHPK